VCRYDVALARVALEALSGCLRPLLRLAGDSEHFGQSRALRDIAMTSWAVALGRRGSGGRGGADEPGLIGHDHELGAVAGAQLDH
jgi:hypothetical protein